MALSMAPAVWPLAAGWPSRGAMAAMVAQNGITTPWIVSTGQKMDRKNSNKICL
jgi:hypothetical protein